MNSWQNGALPLNRLGEWNVQELDEGRTNPDVLVLDVRSHEEGHVPGPINIHTPHIEQKLGEPEPTRTITTYCGSGYRSSIAASVLKKNGFARVVNVPGSKNAWKAAGLPLGK